MQNNAVDPPIGRSTTLRHDQSQVFLPPNVVEVPENQIEDVLRRFGDLRKGCLLWSLLKAK